MSKEFVLREGDVEGIPAAQYIRMSTEHQRYSPDNQKAAIGTFAAFRGFDIVATYQDSGRSGLTLSGRPALKQLLADVLGGDAAFKAILVLDVSRWGRFQDTDQSAHYEYMCREAGVDVHYCSEPFDNDGGALSSIIKHMKRVMAAEFSRELSGRISRAQRHQARLGFKQGGIAPYATRRRVVDELGNHRMVLKPGQRKALSTDKVILVRGPAAEVKLVRSVFEKYVIEEMKLSDIMRWLNGKGKRQANGDAWTIDTIRSMLKNEIYVGRFVFGKRFCNLGRPVPADERKWVSVQMLHAIVPVELFDAAADRLRASTKRKFSDDELRAALSRLYKENGYLSWSLVWDCPYTPKPATLIKRYGSLRAAFRSVGYDHPPNFKRNANGERITNDDLLADLRRIYAKHGRITMAIINADADAQNTTFYQLRFGGMMNAFRLAGLPIKPRNRREEVAGERQREAWESRTSAKKPITRNDDGSRITNDQLTVILKRLLAEHGYLSKGLIDADPAIPTCQFFSDRFGGLRKAYAHIGYLTSQSEIVRAALARNKAREGRLHVF